MFELQSCKIIERERENIERENIDRIFYVNSVTYQSTFVDENNEEYVYTGELILCNKVPSLADCVSDTCNKVPSLADCVSDTCIKFYANKDKVHKKKMTLIGITRLICSTYFDLYINDVLYKRAINIYDLTDLSYVYSTLKKHNFFVYDVMQSLTSPSEYNLLISKEFKQ